MSSTTVAPADGTSIAPTAHNPFSDRPAKPVQGALAEAMSQREIAEIQGAMVIAQRFPRNERDCVDRILNAFTRVELCEKAMYEYARGGTDISGLSIRAAEAIIQQWGNARTGVREVEQHVGRSTAQAYAWDLQTNNFDERTFQVEHIRATKKQTYRLEDPRDIYELVANQGARRKRACILAIIPIDVQRAVEKQVELTLTNKIDVTPERIASLVGMYAELGVTKRAIENLIQRSIESITPLQVLRLGRIYTAIKDGIGAPKDYFEIEVEAEAPATEGKSRTDVLADRLAKKGAGAEAAAKPPEDKAEPVEHPETQQPVDEKIRRAELRTKIAELWKDVPLKVREAIMTREYNQKTLIDLTTGQLEDLHARLPEILSQK
jgi:hypothetical protein